MPQHNEENAMPSPFQGIETASRALRAFQRSLDTTGHNIANVNTQGYSRQVVGLVATPPTTEWAHGIVSLGTGVSVSGISRIRDAMMESRRQDAYSEQGKSEGSLSNLEKVQSTFLDVQGKGALLQLLGRHVRVAVQTRRVF